MAKIYERLLSTNILRGKRRHSFDPQRVTLLGEDSICMVNLLETPRVIVFFFLNEAMILALAGQFKQLSHEPEKTSPVFDHSKEKGPTLVWFLSL